MRAVKAAVTISAVVGLVLTSTGPALAENQTRAKLSKNTTLNLEGVSPHAEKLPGGKVRLYYPSMEAGGTAVSECTKNGACTQVGVIQQTSDLTTVRLQDGTKRAYWVELNPDTKEKTIHTGVISEDGLTLSEKTPLGISSEGAMAWGVPDSVVLPDGRVRLYWVKPDGSGKMASEVIVSATSTDASGRELTRDPGVRTKDGIVDFEVLQAKDGKWLAIASTSPEDPNRAQRLLVATSKDGLKWNVSKRSLTPENMSYLDPTGVKTGKNTWRIYYAKAPNALGEREYQLEQAVLKVKNSKKKAK